MWFEIVKGADVLCPASSSKLTLTTTIAIIIAFVTTVAPGITSTPTKTEPRTKILYWQSWFLVSWVQTEFNPPN